MKEKKPIISKLNEEQELISEWKQKKDPKVLDRIILNHYFMIQSIVNHYNKIGFDRNDLIAEGLLGMLLALDKYDIEKKVKFSTYSYFWIKAKILTFIKKIKPMIDNKKSKIDKDLIHLEDKDYHHFDHIDSIDSHLLYAKQQRVINVDFQETSDFICLDSYKKQLEETSVQKDFDEIFRLSLVTLSTREQTIVEKKWLNKNNLSTKEIAKELNLSEERIRQLEKEILHKLKLVLTDKFGSLKGELLLSSLIYYLIKFKNTNFIH